MLNTGLEGLEASEFPELPELETLFLGANGHEAIALAVSGGADSLALMVLVSLWKKRIFSAPRVVVYSVDHGLRAQAADEVAFVVGQARELGFATRALVWEGEKPATGVQAAAREARYGLMAEAMAKDGATLLLTGHHREDQAETVLMRLAHGSGLGGLGGMGAQARAENIEIFRPLLNLSGNVLTKIVSSAGLKPVVDPSNADKNYERVRWRQALPGLSRLGLDSSTLARFSQRMGRADSALRQMAQSSFDALVARDGFGGLVLQKESLQALPDEIALRVMSMMIHLACGNRGGGELAQLEALVEALGCQRFQGQTISGCVVHCAHGQILVFREVGRIKPKETVVRASKKLVWDQRFVVHNCGEEDLSVAPARSITRAQVKALAGASFHQPMALIRGAPLVRGPGKEIVALGTHSFSPHVCVSHRDELPLI